MREKRKLRFAWTRVLVVWVIDGCERDLTIWVPLHSPCPATFGDCQLQARRRAGSSLRTRVTAQGIHGGGYGDDGASLWEHGA